MYDRGGKFVSYLYGPITRACTDIKYALQLF